MHLEKSYKRHVSIMNNQNPRISVIIPIKIPLEDFTNLQTNISNISDYIENVELILIFDGDENQKVPDLITIDSAKTIRGDFGNPGAARNAGLKESNGDWIWFVDADDLMVLDHIDVLFQELRKDSADIYVGQYIHYLELENRQHIHKDQEFKGLGIDLGIWRMVFRNQILNGVRFPELSMGEDQVFVASILARYPKLQELPFPIYQYWQGGSHHLTANQKSRRDILKTNHLVESVISETNGLSLAIVKLMYMKQLLTIVKYFPLKEKLRAALLLFKAAIVKPGDLMYILKARDIHRENG